MDYLIRIKQRMTFYLLRSKFQKVYNSLKELGDEPFIMPFWQEINRKTAEQLSPKPEIDFLNIRTLKDTMVVDGSQDWLDAQTKYLAQRLGDQYERITHEDGVGGAPMLDAFNKHTSHNTLHHLYHIYLFCEKTGIKVQDIKSVIEWGGGYGNLAKLWYRLSGNQTTYTIIDTSLFCTIQWLYLSSILGQNSVNLLRHRGDSIMTGKINIIPLALLDTTELTGDLFVSTWGLSESTKGAQEYVVSKRRWFGAKHMILGYQDSNKDLQYASRLGSLARQAGAKIVDIDFIPHNHYAFL